MRGNETREHIVKAADDLFYQQGYEHTSFADIAAAVRISRGNFYYHFKTKDEILDAVIEARLASSRAMLAEWEAEGESPADRIRCYIHILLSNRPLIEQYGCPIGTLTSELAKLNHAAQDEATAVFTLFRDWLRDQFAALGHGTESDAMAMHVLAWSQGVATLASAFRDEAFIRREVDQICAWLDAQAPALTGPNTNG